ncbi:hypothetical protein [Legionella brunensis]|nr:hypothetical protein [Legionella brunensis]
MIKEKFLLTYLQPANDIQSKVEELVQSGSVANERVMNEYLKKFNI